MNRSSKKSLEGVIHKKSNIISIKDGRAKVVRAVCLHRELL